MTIDHTHASTITPVNNITTPVNNITPVDDVTIVEEEITINEITTHEERPVEPPPTFDLEENIKFIRRCFDKYMSVTQRSRMEFKQAWEDAQGAISHLNRCQNDWQNAHEHGATMFEQDIEEVHIELCAFLRHHMGDSSDADEFTPFAGGYSLFYGHDAPCEIEFEADEWDYTCEPARSSNMRSRFGEVLSGWAEHTGNILAVPCFVVVPWYYDEASNALKAMPRREAWGKMSLRFKDLEEAKAHAMAFARAQIIKYMVSPQAFEATDDFHTFTFIGEILGEWAEHTGNILPVPCFVVVPWYYDEASNALKAMPRREAWGKMSLRFKNLEEAKAHAMAFARAQIIKYMVSPQAFEATDDFHTFTFTFKSEGDEMVDHIVVHEHDLMKQARPAGLIPVSGVLDLGDMKTIDATTNIGEGGDFTLQAGCGATPEQREQQRIKSEQRARKRQAIDALIHDPDALMALSTPDRVKLLMGIVKGGGSLEDLDEEIVECIMQPMLDE